MVLDELKNVTSIVERSKQCVVVVRVMFTVALHQTLSISDMIRRNKCCSWCISQHSTNGEKTTQLKVVYLSNGGNILIDNGGNILIDNGGNILIDNGGNILIDNGGEILIVNGGNILIDNGGDKLIHIMMRV